MPTDQHGMTHAGSIGLFDDADEIATAIDRSERHERERLGTVIRREERRAERRHRKEAKAAKRQAEGKSKISWPVCWLRKLFGGGKDLSPRSTPPRPVGQANKDDDRNGAKMPILVMTEHVVVRRPVMPERVYTAEDIDQVDSPWLGECGMVKVKSDDAGGCHIVPKSSIQKND